MSSSLILQRFSERLKNPEVLTNPQEFLGLHSPKVLDFWLKIDELSKDQLKIVNERYWAFRRENPSEWDKAVDLAFNTSYEVIDVNYAYNAVWTAWHVTNSWAARWATLELIGGVENPVFLKMFDDL